MKSFRTLGLAVSSLCCLPLVLLVACGSDDGPKSAAPGPDAGVDSGTGGDSGTSTDGAVGGQVEILRDSLGTPYVFGSDLAAASYGLGYATARDRMFQMDVSRRWMRGRLAEWFGPGTGQAHVNSDRYHRILGFAAHAEAVAEALPDDVKPALEAYAKGVNDYLASADFQLPPAYAAVGETSVEPWTVADSLLAWDRLTELFGKNDMNEELKKLVQCNTPAGCQPGCPVVTDESAAQVPNPTLASVIPIEQERFEVPVAASHSWVVSGSRTTTGKPIMHSDPQTLATAPGVWYEAYVSFGDVAARGIGVPGAPGFLIFWNRHIATGGSAAGGDISDLYELELTADGQSYLVDGAATPFTVREETLLVKGGPAQTIQVKESMFGPVVNELLEAPGQGVYAQRHVNTWRKDDHSLVGVLRMMQASNLEQYRDALEHWYAPGLNGIYADVDGHIAYHTLLGIPKRSAHGQHPSQVGRVPNDGTTAAHDWTGPLSASERPHVIDPESGYAITANHLIAGSWFPHYMGLGGGGETVRSLRLRYLFGDALHVDGKPWKAVDPSAKLSEAEVLAMHHDSGTDVARVMRDALAALEQAGIIGKDGSDSRTDRAARTLEALKLFQGQLVTSDPITPLASAITDLAHSTLRPPLPGATGPDYTAVTCKYGSAQGGLGTIVKALDSGDASPLDPLLRDYLLNTASGAWSQASQPGTPSTWKTYAPEFVVKYQSNFMCKDGPGLCSLSPASDIAVVLTTNSQSTILSQPGNSYSQFISLADLSTAKSVFPTGASEDPNSPWFQNRVERWVAQELDPAPLEKSVIEADAVETLVLKY